MHTLIFPFHQRYYTIGHIGPELKITRQVWKSVKENFFIKLLEKIKNINI